MVFLVLDRAPEAHDEDIVAPAGPAIHADLNALAALQAGERGAGKLRPLVGVEDLGPAVPVTWLQTAGPASDRRACRVAGIAASSYRYASHRPARDAPVRRRLWVLAGSGRGGGVRSSTDSSRARGW